MFASTPEEALKRYEEEHGEGSAAENRTSFSCAKTTDVDQDLTGANAWVDELIAQGWVEQPIGGGYGAARDMLSADGTIRAGYYEFGEGGQLMFAWMEEVPMG